MTQPKYIVTEEVVRELVAALEPFAKMADELDVLVKGEELWEHDDTQWINVNKFCAMPTVGNLRAARAAIREGGKDDAG